MERLKLPMAESQDFLLKTIVGGKSQIAGNYNNWVSSVNINKYIDGESYALIPALYKLLEEIGYKDKDTPKYMGIYKKNFYNNGLLLGLLQQIGTDFNSLNIPFVLLKGITMIINYNLDVGIRSLGAIDISVEKENFPKAIEILNKHGFISTGSYDTHKNTEVHSYYLFKNDQGMEINIYPAELSFLNITLDEPRELLYKNVRCLILSPEDFILQDCLCGDSIRPLVHTRWIYNLHIIINNEPEINWNTFINKLKGTVFSYTFFVVFEYFNEISSIKIPDWVLGRLFELGSNKPCIRDARKRFIKPKTVFGKLGWYRYNLQFKKKSFLFRIFKFPGYVLMTSQYTRYIDLFSAFVKKYILKTRA